MTKIDLPFLSRERGKTGKWFYRFQRHGKKVRIQGVPGSPEWIAHYVHLRDSTPMTEPPMVNVGMARTKPNSFGRLCEKYLEHYGKQVSAGQRSQSTLTMKNHLLGTLATTLGDEPARSIRRSDLIRARDEMASAPAKADNVIRAVRAMFNWAVDMDYVEENPAIRIPKLQRKTDGWEPWTANDINQFLGYHKPGTTPYLAFLLLYFTAARRSDVVRLGWQNVREIDGAHYLVFKPEKPGTTAVQIEIAPQLMDALKAQAPNSPVFLQNSHGRPYSAASFGNTFRKWTTAAGLSGHSPHGIRKAVGDILADSGATNYEIMSIHGHLNPTTSEIYTRRANRRDLARAAVRTLGSGLQIASKNM